MDELRYTQFPDLFSTADVENRSTEHTLSQCRVRWVDLADEVVIIAWAVLLRAYTSQNALVFRVDDRNVKVDATTWTVRDATHVGSSTDRSTSICFVSGNQKDQDICLRLLYDRREQKTFLCASSKICCSHLDQIALQFEEACFEAAQLRGLPNAARTERKPCVSAVNRSPHRSAGPSLLHDLVRWQDRQDTIALEFVDIDGVRATMTYSELERQSSQVASQVLAMLPQTRIATEKRVVVPIFVAQSSELYIAMLGVLRAGAAYCPINLDTPIERVKFILGDIGASVICTVSSCRNKLSDYPEVQMLEVDTLLQSPPPETFNVSPRIEATDAAYVM